MLKSSSHRCRFPARLPAALLLGLVLGTGGALVRAAETAPTTDGPPHVDERTTLQRELYTEAREALKQGHREAYQRLRGQLDNYPLAPYLDYADIRDRLDERPNAEVDRFLDKQAGSYLAERLEREWVAELAKQERWEEVLRYHDPANSYTVLNCQALRARLETGDHSAFSEVAGLWNADISQPNECDPVFDPWIEKGYLTPDIAWERLGKALQAGHRQLARYVAGLIPEPEQEMAELYLWIDNRPEQLADHEALGTRSPEMREIILHGIRRLARIDAPQAMLRLHRHDDRQNFDEQVMRDIQRYIAACLIRQGFVDETESLLRNIPELITADLVGSLLRDALRKQDWDRLESWLDRLPPDARESERWTYWRARMLARKEEPAATAKAESLYRQLAGNRNFYGFLSADRLDRDYELDHRPAPVSAENTRALYELPAIVRAYELYQLGDDADALNEWEHAIRRMNREQIMSSGRLAASWGWHRNSIQAMIRTGYRDDLELRFPLAYEEIFRNAAADHQAIQPQFLLAIARQESAFMRDARSPAGARGLMQLIPGTARQTANGVGMSMSRQDLYRPEINITLGSRYLAELLEEFDGNRALAAAAYNAGPNRVKQWLRRDAGNPLPLEQWIETIPFAETRSYVQNVLSYSVIFSQRMNEPVPLLTGPETRSTL